MTTYWDTTTLANSGAKWIAESQSLEAKNLYLQFARRFDLMAPAEARLLISAASQYRVSVNGQEIGRGPAVSSPNLWYFHTYTIEASLLRRGRNLISVLLFHDGQATTTVQGFQYGGPGLIAALLSDEVTVVTDDTWQVRRAPEYSPLASLVSQWGGYKEYFHGENLDHWESPEYDHSAWERAVVVADAESENFVRRLVPLDVPELEHALIKPERLVELSQNLGRARNLRDDSSTPYEYGDAVIAFSGGEACAAPAATFDYGAMVVGYPELEISGSECILEIWYGESLDLYRLDVIRLPNGGTWRAFQRRAYRYLQIKAIALEGTIRLSAVRHHSTWYAYDKRGHLETSDAFANRLLDVSRRTLKANSSYHYEDCPWREQALWIMDMRIMGRINAYLYGNHELTAKCLRQSFAIQRADGHIAATGPKDNTMFLHDFLFHLVATLKEHYHHTGDLAIVREHYPNLQKLHAFIAKWRGDDGLLDTERCEPVHPFLDWSASIEKVGITTILNALYKLYLEDLAELSALCEDANAAEKHCAEAQRVKHRIHEVLFWPEKGVYRDAVKRGVALPTISQQANMAAILADIPPPGVAESIMAKVWDTGKYARPFGPSFYLIIFDALAKIGRFDAMLDVMREYWGAMLDRGATTWWEVFDPSTPEWAYPHPFLGNTPTYEMDWIPVSTCHGWSGVPAYAIPQFLLGLDLSHMHERKVTIRPALQGYFESAEYTLPLAGGLLRLSYRRSEDGYAIRVLEKPADIEVIV